MLHGRDAEALARETDALTADGASVSSAAFDVTEEDAVEHGVARVLERVGAIDVLVNNAGVQSRAPFTEFPTAEWHRLVATNLTSAFLVSRAVARGMQQRGRGKIIHIGSVQFMLGRPGITPYAATKGGIAMLTRGMCADLGPSGIQVNAIAPGYFATDLTAPLVADPDFSDWVERRTPAGRWGRVDELIGAAVFLSSRASDFVNGQVLTVDGGMTAVV
ncbi:SDR family oxidoreductase [Amnibacterium soli]|uniref:SDR family oxidoreductase n=1 Tax=Amnibacterium soli TaxID=1282736 RepID=A0ABP8ZHP9_9MICO